MVYKHNEDVFVDDIWLSVNQYVVLSTNVIIKNLNYIDMVKICKMNFSKVSTTPHDELQVTRETTGTCH